MAITAENPAPYAPSSAILDIIDRVRNRGLPRPITSEVLGRAGVSDSLIPRTLQSLQTLELIDEQGNPTETLENLRRAKEGELKGRLADWIRAVYADVLTFVDPATDDETAIRDAFRNYNPVGQQPRMLSLFLGLCRAAGMRSGELVKESRPRPAARKANKPSGQNGKGARSAKTHSELPANLSGELPPPIAGLLGALPASGKSWTKAERDKFVQTFGTILDFCYPVNTTVTTDGEEIDPLS